ncbi:uncharacterized protein [Primulina huaijiensis]|uniref:uncharacterized protein n=1 Tax=Primulina huaijiensis TaxID=1492673 RepID=UPI003CC75867
MDMADARVRCTIYLLKDDTSLWWERAERGVNLVTLTWEDFKRVFYDKYFTSDLRSRLKREFMTLRQGDSTVAEFVQKFDRGCHFVLLIANDAAEKLRHFLYGLRPTIRHDVMLTDPTDYTTIIAKDFRAEQSLKDIDWEMQRKRNCAQQATGIDTYALLDSGATHSFIPESFVKKLRILTVDIGSGFRVIVLSDEHMVSSSVVKGVELKLQNNIIRTNLIVLNMPEFDIILGMDWLTLNGATIDFRRRSASIRPPDSKAFVFEAKQKNQMSHIISCMHAKKLIQKRCQGFLASIISTPDIDSRSIEYVEVVKDFSDVFPDDVSGISPEREVEFAIELMPGTVTISKEPYRLAPGEMKELKDQVQELLDKGFIRPSFSP